MFEKTTRKGRGLASAFGLALAAMLVLGAIVAGAAQASPVWKIGGKTLAEKGISQEEFISEGTFKIESPSLKLEILCSETASGYIIGKSELEEKISFTNCKIPHGEACKVEPSNTDWLKGTSDELLSKDIYSEGWKAFMSIHLVGVECPLTGFFEEVKGGIFLPQYGPEAAKLAVTTSGTAHYGKELLTFSGTSTWRLTGINKGKAFGAK